MKLPCVAGRKLLRPLFPALANLIIGIFKPWEFMWKEHFLPL